ncbi:isoflavone reductase family protein [Macrophomina phaseolina]|uniref:Isoflavone reductase family protein n=1 Tax=Macrophomina phaseolina TaxID=35725 RepID=A0ABQ8FXJ3_9PEZI|nr:isoflavone reductase family protein [Macrophomina phaseolina]
MTSLKNILIIGASGALGVPTLNEFLNAAYKVSILSRKESTTTFPDGVKVFKADYKDLDSVKAAMEGQDVVISIVGGHAVSDQRVLIDAALAAGVKRFFPSEYGPYTRDPKMAEINPYTNPYKTAIVDYLRSKEHAMSWTALVTGGFFDWAMGNGFYGFDFATKTVGLIDDGVSAVASTTLATIAKAIRASVEHADETKNQYVFVASFHHSQREILNEIEKLDDQKWTVNHLSSEDVIANGRRRVEAGDFAGIMDLTRGAALGKLGLADLRPLGLWNERLGLPKDDIAEVLKKHIYKDI